MFYVYAHRVKGKIIYIGCGSRTRPYDMSSRSRHWRRCVGNRDVDIRIVAKFRNRSDALAKEAEMIDEVHPDANLHPGRPPVGRVPLTVRVSEADLAWLTREGEAMRLSGAHVAGVVLAEAVAARRKRT